MDGLVKPRAVGVDEGDKVLILTVGLDAEVVVEEGLEVFPHLSLGPEDTHARVGPQHVVSLGDGQGGKGLPGRLGAGRHH